MRSCLPVRRSTREPVRCPPAATGAEGTSRWRRFRAGRSRSGSFPRWVAKAERVGQSVRNGRGAWSGWTGWPRRDCADGTSKGAGKPGARCPGPDSTPAGAPAYPGHEPVQIPNEMSVDRRLPVRSSLQAAVCADDDRRGRASIGVTAAAACPPVGRPVAQTGRTVRTGGVVCPRRSEGWRCVS